MTDFVLGFQAMEDPSGSDNHIMSAISWCNCWNGSSTVSWCSC
jgi:hypothetical protein